MSFTPHGKHLINGEWLMSERTFPSDPVTGKAHAFAVGTPEFVSQACAGAETAFQHYGYTTRAQRAEFLNAIANEIDARGEVITEIGCQETGLPEARLQGERGRTTGQLRLFAEHILKGDYLDRRHDQALPDRQPLPRPDLKLINRPIGPVAVFGASNFPLAFSTAGGDTAAALAAGCPVVVKGHSAHPGTGEIVAEAIHAAIAKTGMPTGVFSLIQGGNRQVGTALVQNPLIRAVGFTGSLTGGRALFDLCAARPDPIPFFGELGSVNPMFLLPEALASRAAEIGAGWAGSLTMGVGQFCTKPGVAVVPAGADAFVQGTADALSDVAQQPMLTEGIAEAYRQGVSRLSNKQSAVELVGTACATRAAEPYLYKVSATDWLADSDLHNEVFGPLGLVVEAQTAQEMAQVANALEGQLTCTLHMDEADTPQAQELLPVIERKAGRVLVNGFPTGVEVADSMVHGGPYPASTNFGATSVGTLSIRRFLRPVCYQNVPEALLPEVFD